MHVGMEGIAYQRSCIKRYYEALREDLQLKNMSRKSYTALGSLNSIPRFCLSIPRSLTIYMLVVWEQTR